MFAGARGAITTYGHMRAFGGKNAVRGMRRPGPVGKKRWIRGVSERCALLREASSLAGFCAQTTRGPAAGRTGWEGSGQEVSSSAGGRP